MTSCLTLKPLNKERVVVLPLKKTAGVKEGKLHHLSNLLRQAAGRLPSHNYSVITQDNILVLLPANVSIEDCEGTCAVDIGRRLWAH